MDTSSEEQFLRSTFSPTGSPFVSPSEQKKIVFPSNARHLVPAKEIPFFSRVFKKDHPTIVEAPSELEAAYSGRSMVSSQQELSERKKLNTMAGVIHLRKSTTDSNQESSRLNISPVINPIRETGEKNMTSEGKESERNKLPSSRLDTLRLEDIEDEQDKEEEKMMEKKKRNHSKGTQSPEKNTQNRRKPNDAKSTKEVSKTRLARIREMKSEHKPQKAERTPERARDSSTEAINGNSMIKEKKKTERRSSPKKPARKKNKEEEAPTPHFHAKASILLSEENENNISQGLEPRSKDVTPSAGSLSLIGINTSQSMAPLVRKPSLMMSEIWKDTEPVEIESPLPKIKEKRRKSEEEEKSEKREKNDKKEKKEKKEKKKKDVYEVKEEGSKEKEKPKEKEREKGKEKTKKKEKATKPEKIEKTEKIAGKNKDKDKVSVKDSEKKEKAKPKKKEGIISEKESEPKPKKILLTDGLNLVKLMTDRKNQKKTKLFIILFTLTVLWSILLNSLEFGFLFNTKCKIPTEIEISFVSFIITIILKLFCISFFNLELTFSQPYKLSLRLLYPFLFHLFSPILQIPQNIYDFRTCKSSNQIIQVADSWRYQQAILGSMVMLFLYSTLTKGLSKITTNSRLFRLFSRALKGLLVLFGIVWNLVLIIIFAAQKDIFLPSFFFDFYLYVGLGICMVLFYRGKKKLGENKLPDLFIKVEKEETKIDQPSEMVKFGMETSTNLLVTSHTRKNSWSSPKNFTLTKEDVSIKEDTHN